jgi:hypothetical protein
MKRAGISFGARKAIIQRFQSVPVTMLRSEVTFFQKHFRILSNHAGVDLQAAPKAYNWLEELEKYLKELGLARNGVAADTVSLLRRSNVREDELRAPGAELLLQHVAVPLGARRAILARYAAAAASSSISIASSSTTPVVSTHAPARIQSAGPFEAERTPPGPLALTRPHPRMQAAPCPSPLAYPRRQQTAPHPFGPIQSCDFLATDPSSAGVGPLYVSKSALNPP